MPPFYKPFLTPYQEKLRHPRWQKKRLEVFSRDKFTCQICGDKETNLQVHHEYYIPHTEPWDYSLDALTTLCENCHERVTYQEKDSSEWYSPDVEKMGKLMLKIIRAHFEELRKQRRNQP